MIWKACRSNDEGSLMQYSYDFFVETLRKTTVHLTGLPVSRSIIIDSMSTRINADHSIKKFNKS
jgi:hypothetical protein